MMEIRNKLPELEDKLRTNNMQIPEMAEESVET